MCIYVCIYIYIYIHTYIHTHTHARARAHTHTHTHTHTLTGQDSSVGTATRYGLDGPQIEIPVWERFSAPVQTGPGAHPVSYTMDPGGKAAGA